MEKSSMFHGHKTAVLGAAALALAALSWGVLGQSSPGEPVSMAEVQAFIEEKVGEGFPVDEVISSGLELGYRPELLAAALMNLSLEPAVIAVALASEGVTRVEAAKAVITVAGPPSSAPVMEALLIGAPAEEAQTLTAQVTELVTQLVANTTPETPPAGREVVATTEPEAEATPAQESTEVAQEPTTTEPETAPTTTAEAETTPEPTPTTEVVTTVEPTPEPVIEPPPVVVVVVEPTPPIMGGGGGGTLN